VFLSANNGTTWSEVDSGLTNRNVIALTVSGTNLFAGISGGGVWRRPLSEMTTAVPLGSNKLPGTYALLQNYPNPFNPTTEISYQLPAAGFVTLNVYDVLGRKAKTLVSERQNAGTHSLTLNAAGLSSGVYFYRLTAGNFVDTKKLLLLK